MKSKIKVFLLDDEPAIASVLENYFLAYFPQVEVVGKSFDWQAGIDQVTNLKPDLVFLDIRMPGGTGFDFLEFFGKERGFQVVFVTGYEEYALKALKAEAVDYLLKPIDAEELKEAIRKVEERLRANTKVESQKPEGFFLVSVNDKKVKLLFSEIAFARADSNYTLLYLQNGEKYILAKTLKEVEQSLQDHSGFLRINRDYLVNRSEIKSYTKRYPFEIALRTGEVLPISRRKKAEVMKVLEG